MGLLIVGTAVIAAGFADRQENRPDRNFGSYADRRWAPTWDAELVDREDFGVPPDWAVAAGQIDRAFRRAGAGTGVEVGCAGGLGRTGTVLACMAILAGVPPENAVE